MPENPPPVPWRYRDRPYVPGAGHFPKCAVRAGAGSPDPPQPWPTMPREARLPSPRRLFSRPRTGGIRHPPGPQPQYARTRSEVAPFVASQEGRGSAPSPPIGRTVGWRGAGAQAATNHSLAARAPVREPLRGLRAGRCGCARLERWPPASVARLGFLARTR